MATSTTELRAASHTEPPTSPATCDGVDGKNQNFEDTVEETTEGGRSIALWERVTLRAVPVHVDNADRLYNPYHLRIVGREVDCSNRPGKGQGRKDADVASNESFVGDDKMVDGFVSGGENSGYYDDGLGRSADQDEWVSGFEGEGAGNSTDVGEGDGHTGGMEMASFRARGVTYVNTYGETSFQLLEDWRRDKERFDVLSRKNFCRR